MMDSDHERFDRDIERIEQLLVTHGEDIAVLKNVIMGNGSPGLIKMLDSASHAIDGMNERLTRVEHQNKFVKMRNTDIWSIVRNIIYIATFVMSLGLNVYLLLSG